MLIRLEDAPLYPRVSPQLAQAGRGELGRGPPGRAAMPAVGSSGRAGCVVSCPFPSRPALAQGQNRRPSSLPGARLQVVLHLSFPSPKARASRQGRCPLPEPSPSSRLWVASPFGRVLATLPLKSENRHQQLLVSRAVLGGLGGKCSRVWWAQVEKEGFGLSVYFTCCVTSGKLPNLSVPPFPQLRNRSNNSNNHSK